MTKVADTATCSTLRDVRTQQYTLNKCNDKCSGLICRFLWFDVSASSPTFKNWTIICCLVMSLTSPLPGWSAEEPWFSCSAETSSSSEASMSVASTRGAASSLSPALERKK